MSSKTIENINEIKSWLFENINKINIPLARLQKREKSPRNKIRNEIGNIIADTTEIQIINYKRLL